MGRHRSSWWVVVAWLVFSMILAGPARAAPPATSSTSFESLATLSDRLADVRERLLIQATDRGAIVTEYAGLALQFSKRLESDRDADLQTTTALLKAYVTLAAVDPPREAEWVRRAQPLVDRLTTGPEPMVRRRIEGLSVVFRGDAGSKDVALTFDGGPAPATGQILDLLEAEGVKATFFLLGRFAQKDPDTCRRIVTDGHSVANHTMTHAHWKGLARIAPSAGERDIVLGHEAISKATGVEKIDLFRPPYGSGGENRAVCSTIARNHPYSIMWTIDTWDSLGAKLDRQVQRVLGSKKLPGAIILCHDHSSQIVTLVRTIVPALKRRGFRFVTVPDMIASSEKALRARRLAEVCVKLQNDARGSLASAALEIGREPGDDRILLEALDLAYLVTRLCPDPVLSADAVREEIFRRFGPAARWAGAKRPSVVE